MESKYVLEIKQIIDYPRVRIHRELIQKLITDESLSAHGNCRLFSFMTLCSYANFRSSRIRIDGISHLIGPGEWICGLREIANWFRCRRLYRATEILEELAVGGFISYQFLPGTNLIQYRILNWEKFNTVLEYECRCQKDCGFFFFPICYGTKLLEGKRCSEPDILMDLWLNTIYKDHRVYGSDLGPVVYFRNGSGDPLTSCSRLAIRWGLSRATISRTLGKLERLGYLNCLTFSGRHGTVIYLENYLSTMFEIADLPVDKDEVAMKLKLRIKTTAPVVANASVSSRKISVSKSAMLRILPKVLQALAAQGFSCCACKKKTAILYSLSAACEGWILEVTCGKHQQNGRTYRFEVHVINNSG